jgi:outer membrane protein OmpA-like peptidoglycan-associated protein
MRARARNAGPDWTAQMKASAKILLDDATDTDDAKGLWTDAETTGRQGNARFFADFNYPRNFDNVSREVQQDLRAAGVIAGTHRIAAADWDWQSVTGLSDVSAAAAPRFDVGGANKAVADMHAEGKIDNDTLFSFDIHFKPNQRDFAATMYGTQFDQVVQLASTYSGAVLTIEGHADPLGYLRKRAEEERRVTWTRSCLAA